MSELYLKDKKVLTIKDIEGVPSEVEKIDNPELLPVCLKNKCDTEDLKKWFLQRNIPENREGFNEMKAEFGTSWLENKNFASLSDQYWLKKREETWKKINFFTNLYSKDIGEMAFKPWSVTKKRFDSFSPDLTTNGVLRKRWVQHSKDRPSCLVKAGSCNAHQDPLSEVLVSILAEQLDIIPCVKYDLHIEGTTMCTISENFITQDTELVPASYIYYLEERKDNETVYHHLLKMCEKFNIPGAQEFIDGMLFIDNLCGNEDRNLGNIGFIRNINTMKFEGPAPLFDSGNAFWNTKQVTASVKSKLFGDVEEDVCKKVRKTVDLDKFAKNFGYKKLIYSYPCITRQKKENLVEAISKRDNRLVKGKDLYEK